jgi:hypothetical protein
MFNLNLPKNDAAVMKQAYERGRQIPGVSAEQFIRKISARIYAEWCMNTSWYQHNNYEGQAYDRWKNDETHYALERRQDHGCVSSEYQQRKYELMREEIIRAIAQRATELFSDWKGNWWPADAQDDRNLRGNLEPHLSENLGRVAPPLSEAA